MPDKSTFPTKTIWPVLAALALTSLLLALPAAQKKVFILGIDGLDPKLLEQFMSQGDLPNFKKLVAEGDFKPLQTTMPPLSPVAWSTFITGMDPGGHAIFDFLQRDPAAMIPEFAMSEVIEPEWKLELGSWVLPLSAGGHRQRRLGQAFWQILEEEGISTTIFRMPANFPPAESPGRAFSGMGTPDILGTPGTFSFYTSDPPANADEISGGQIFEVEVRQNRVQAELAGPENAFRRFATDRGSYRSPRLKIDFEVFLDTQQPVAKFVVQDDEFILKEGEWSDWIRVDFEAIPYLVGVSATARFYLKQVRPDFRLYVSPLQIDPAEPAMPLSTPADWSAQLAADLGHFYTQELPEDTKAFSGGILSGREFWEQAQSVYRERRRALDYILERFEGGLSFFYFSSVDQGAHMLWHYMDEKHPMYESDDVLEDGIRTLYRQMDESLGRVMAGLDKETTLIVMSDHGFSPFYQQVNLNSWLLESGYVKLRDPSQRGRYPWFGNVDWSGTRAYAVGLNGLYLNLRGRERQGIVSQGTEQQRVLDQLEQDLLAMKDPVTGENVVTLVIQTRRDFKGQSLREAPDIIVGYNWGYRTSWKSPLGEFPTEVLIDNDDAWSGDHSIDYRLVPGVLISNRKITLEQPALYDLTVAVLDEFGVDKRPEMIGTDCLGPAAGLVQTANSN